MGKDIVLGNGNTLNMEKLGLKPMKSADELLDTKPNKTLIEKLLVVLLDSSGSMHESMGTYSKMSIAWRVLRDELVPNMAGWAYGILSFFGWVETKWIVKVKVPQKAMPLLAPYPSGGTPMLKGLQDAWEYIKGHSKEARMVLISDGQPDELKDDILQFVEHVTVPIDTVGVGSANGHYDPEFLERISQITGGVFVKANSADSLAKTILKLAPANRPLLGSVN